ncbi:MAG: Fe-S protein-like protein [Firmicutes bacterium]|nr:Fe-S protein-like protein [Bacillota bacterium]
MELIGKIIEIVGDRSDTLWSISDISYSKFKEDFTRAIILAQHYNHFISNAEYDEKEYHDIILEIRMSIDQKINLLRNLFDQYGIKNFVPPVAQTDEIELVAPFSFKYAAVQSGLGWIGKNGVLITREFGPRVRLGAILVDFPLICGKPIKESLCGNCHACVDACSWGVIKGVNWNISSRREELLNYKLCNKKRSEYIKTNSRKHTCGYCILACPWGIKEPGKQ